MVQQGNMTDNFDTERRNGNTGEQKTEPELAGDLSQKCEGGGRQLHGQAGLSLGKEQGQEAGSVSCTQQGQEQGAGGHPLDTQVQEVCSCLLPPDI